MGGDVVRLLCVVWAGAVYITLSITSLGYNIHVMIDQSEAFPDLNYCQGYRNVLSANHTSHALIVTLHVSFKNSDTAPSRSVATAAATAHPSLDP